MESAKSDGKWEKEKSFVAFVKKEFLIFWEKYMKVNKRSKMVIIFCRFSSKFSFENNIESHFLFSSILFPVLQLTLLWCKFHTIYIYIYIENFLLKFSESFLAKQTDRRNFLQFSFLHFVNFILLKKSSSRNQPMKT